VDDLARVVLALEAPEVVEEVLHYLDRSGRARVVATAEDRRQLAEAVKQLEPDAVVAEPTLAADGLPTTASLLAIATRESVSSLRAAVSAGARAYYVWPTEREGLLDGVAGCAAERRVPERRATVVAVHAARGGAGCTFIATHLAQAIERDGSSCVLVDADLARDDLTQALGAAKSEGVRTIAELVPVADELAWPHLEEVLWRGAVLAPPVERLGEVDDGLIRTVVSVAASVADVVVVHVPRELSITTLWCLEQADRVLEVVALDVLSFRAASRALEVLSPLGIEVGFVVNRAARNEITPGDVRRVFGTDPLAVVPYDAAAGRAQDHGRLLAPKGRTGRAIGKLAATLLAGERTGTSPDKNVGPPG
jgi:Flp pilus assembly CpaE family ATPase